MTALDKQSQTKDVKGAAHFQVSLPMRFRILGEKSWHDGWAESMSLTEMLFRTDRELACEEVVDFRIKLRNPPQGASGGVILGHATVRRGFSLAEMPGQMIYAASLSSPRLLRLTGTSKN